METSPQKIENLNNHAIDQVLTVSDVQRILKISRAMSYELVNSGIFPVLRIGRTIRVPSKPFQDWLYSNNPVAS
jgi:hypothetical protein